MNAIRAMVLLLAVNSTVLSAACASSSASDERRSRPARRSASVITRDELASSTARDALQAVQMLRPDWLRGRGATSFSGGVPQVVIYLDGQRMGNREVLEQFPTTGITEIRFYSASDATQRWGTGHSGGVIEVVTR